MAAVSAPQRVFVFSLVPPKPGTKRERRRFQVRWRLDGRDRTRSFKTRAEGDRFRAALQVAVKDGLAFDPVTGLPEEWVEQTDQSTWWTWSGKWLRLKWPHWSGHSRRSAVESLALLTPLLVRAGAPSPPAGLREWLRETGFRPDAPPPGEKSAWLDRWSIPLVDITPGRVEDVLTAVTTKADGNATVVSVTRRRRNALGAVLRSAVRRGLLTTNPMDKIETKAPARSLAIDISTVPSPTDVAAIVDHVTAMPSIGARYGALLAAVGIAGMRPSEAIGLDVRDLELPEHGWGLARLRGALPSPGARYTANGAVAEAKGLKQRAEGTVREVPLSPDLVARLVLHIDRFESINGRVFSNAAGRPVTPTNYGPVWGRARAKFWPEGHRLAAVTVYDLRHAAATMMLRAGVPPAEVALRLGHSVDVLMRVYAGVFDDERERSNGLIDEAMASRP